MAGKVIPIGPLEKRASSVISNSALYDLVQDIAHKVDQVDPRLDTMDRKLDLILEILHGRTAP